MEESNDYSYSISGGQNQIATIKLGKQVLGGIDALLFTSKLQELTDKNIKYLIIDLHDVEVINSSGLGMLVSGLSTLRKYKIGMLLADLSAKVSGLLVMTHLNKVFKIYPTVEAALSACK